MASREGDRTAADVLEPVPLMAASSTIEEAAQLLIDCGCPILAVVDADRTLAGVVTDWDIVRATAEQASRKTSLEAIMTRQVISAGPDETLLEILRKLELNQISAMPIVDAGRAIGMVSSDLLARRSLLRMLQSQSSE
jgi:CBS domain-containing protein